MRASIRIWIFRIEFQPRFRIVLDVRRSLTGRKK